LALCPNATPVIEANPRTAAELLANFIVHHSNIRLISIARQHYHQTTAGYSETKRVLRKALCALLRSITSSASACDEKSLPGPGLPAQ
jgi:hypothetical protein